MSFKEYLEEAFAKNEYDIKKRPYDGLYNVWRKHLEVNEDNSFSVWWEVVSVENSLNSAKEFIEKIVRK